MEITTLSNLMALASDTSGISFDAGDAKLSGEEFYEIIREIYDKIDMLKKWTRDGKQFLSLEQFNLILVKTGGELDSEPVIAQVVRGEEIQAQEEEPDRGEASQGGLLREAQGQEELEAGVNGGQRFHQEDADHEVEGEGGTQEEVVEKTDEVLNFYYGQFQIIFKMQPNTNLVEVRHKNQT